MRIQTKRECEEQERRHRLAKQDIRNVNAEKAGMALELVTARQWIDRWRHRALRAEDANRRLHAENQGLIAKLAGVCEEERDCE